jgi:predicted alpha/beta hydrolase family esterase
MKAYLIPGWGEDLNDRDYSSVLATYKKCGYAPQFVPINWKHRTIDDWTEEVKLKITKQDLQSSLLSGFSWGAMTALVLAAEYQNPKRLLLFSLSPYFAEDLPSLKKWWLDAAGKRRVANFKKLPMASLAAKINCPTIIFAGLKEGKQIEKRAREANLKIKKSKLIMLDGVKHDVADPRYIEAIRKALK